MQKGFKKLVSYFKNESFLSIENEQARNGNSFNFNPFNFDENNLIGLNYSLRNSLHFNKNLQKYSTSYTYGNQRNKQLYFIGTQENIIKMHQVDFAHKFATFWVFNLLGKKSTNNLVTENFDNRNYNIDAYEFQPKISFFTKSKQPIVCLLSF